MPVELKVPEIGESIREVQIGQWRKAVGDSADKDENLVEIETDKATVDLPAPVAGVITQMLKKQGETAAVGEVIGYIDESSTAAAKPAAQAPDAGAAAAPAKSSGDSARVMPSAARVLAEKGLSPGQVDGSGPGGRVLKEDAQRAGAAPAKAPPTAPSKASPAPGKPAAAPKTALVKSEPGRSARHAMSANQAGREEEIVPMTPMRRTIAERLVDAQHNAALLTTFNEIDMTEIMELRKKHRDVFQERYGIKLGFMSFFVKACVDALKLVPQVNAEIRENNIVYKNYYDIGIAVGGGKGLVVPVIRNADYLSFAEIEMTIGDFGRRAQDNKIKLEELQGGTFTISNGGVYGSLLSTPIVNPPQSGILGLHAIQDRPVARNGQVVIRPMMYVALTYDHRIVDGREGVTFLKRIKDAIEEPSRILLEV